MKQFEYRHFAYCADSKWCKFHKHANYPDFQAELDKLGREGFELKGMSMSNDYYRWDRIMPGDEDNVPRIESEGRNFEPEL